MIEILEKFPFLTLGIYGDTEQEYLGIIGNSDSQLLSMYIYNLLPDDEMKKMFLQFGEQWWWETNRQIPINIALKESWTPFRIHLKTFMAKDFKIISGPCVSLDNVIVKRIKRRHITLVKKI